MSGPNGGEQAPQAAAVIHSRARGAPGCQVMAASAPSSAAYPIVIGGRALRGPCRSISLARQGDSRELVSPNRAITTPAAAYEPVARVTARTRDRKTTP
ncbi:MAG: hypothetical protein WAK82_09495 [Streptosporangiaceae bacterium]